METITRAAIQRSNPMIWAGIPRVKKNEITVNNIVEIVAAHYNIKPEILYIKSREYWIVHPRQIAWYFISKKLKLGKRTIGGIFNFDHSTVLYGIRNVENQMSVDDDYKDLVTKIESKI